MKDDFSMICFDFEDAPYINLYPIGDVHLGSAECDMELFGKLIDTVKKDKYGYAVLVGDMLNMGLKSSRSNIYEEVMMPREQKHACYQLLKPIAGKILCGCSGNHEYRSVKEVGTNPLYDVFCRLGIEDRYRENACFVRLQVGTCHHNPNVYGLVVTHGKSKNKDEKWTYAVDGCDVFISGHTHNGSHQPLGKIKMDLTHKRVKTEAYHHIVVVPFQKYGGYALRDKYLPSKTSQFQRLTFSGKEKKVGYSFN